MKTDSFAKIDFLMRQRIDLQ